MPAVPRFRRTEPNGPVTPASEPIPVLTTIRWHGGHTTEEQAVAVAWTQTEVEVTWTDPWGAERTDWVEAVDVRRPGAPARATHASAQHPDRAPRSMGRRPRW